MTLRFPPSVLHRLREVFMAVMLLCMLTLGALIYSAPVEQDPLLGSIREQPVARPAMGPLVASKREGTMDRLAARATLDSVIFLRARMSRDLRDARAELDRFADRMEDAKPKWHELEARRAHNLQTGRADGGAGEFKMRRLKRELRAMRRHERSMRTDLAAL